MTNVIEFRRPMDFTAASVDDFILWLELLTAHARMARRKILGAKSLEKVLVHYGEWLRRYWEANGGVQSLWRHIDEYVEVHGREADLSRCDDISDFMVEVEKLAKGPRPWMSLPQFERTRSASITNLDAIIDNLNRARGKAEAIGRSKTLPDERTPA